MTLQNILSNVKKIKFPIKIGYKFFLFFSSIYWIIFILIIYCRINYHIESKSFLKLTQANAFNVRSQPYLVDPRIDIYNRGLGDRSVNVQMNDALHYRVPSDTLAIDSSVGDRLINMQMNDFHHYTDSTQSRTDTGIPIVQRLPKLPSIDHSEDSFIRNIKISPLSQTYFIVILFCFLYINLTIVFLKFLTKRKLYIYEKISKKIYKRFLHNNIKNIKSNEIENMLYTYNVLISFSTENVDIENFLNVSKKVLENNLSIELNLTGNKIEIEKLFNIISLINRFLSNKDTINKVNVFIDSDQISIESLYNNIDINDLENYINLSFGKNFKISISDKILKIKIFV